MLVSVVLFCVISNLSWIRPHINSVDAYLNARIRCFFNVFSNFNVIPIFSGIRSHYFPFTGGQQLNYARICCFVSVISNLSRIRPHLNSVDDYLNACIRCFFNVFSNFSRIQQQHVSQLNYFFSIVPSCTTPHTVLVKLFF